MSASAQVRRDSASLSGLAPGLDEVSAAPRSETARRVDEDVGRLQMGAGLRVPLLRAFEACERMRLPAGPTDFQNRSAGYPAARRCNSGRFGGLFPVVRGPGRLALPLGRLPPRQLQQALERAAMIVHGGVAIPTSANRDGVVRSVKSPGSHASISSHDNGAETRASAVGRTE
jgi:hypothetical protein